VNRRGLAYSLSKSKLITRFENSTKSRINDGMQEVGLTHSAEETCESKRRKRLARGRFQNGNIYTQEVDYKWKQKF